MIELDLDPAIVPPDELEAIARKALAARSRRVAALDPRRMSEIEFRRQIVGKGGLVEILHWQHVGFRPAQTKFGWRTPGTGTMAKGWPDLTLVRERDHRLVFAELKGYQASGARGRLSPDQVIVLDILRCLEFEGSPVTVRAWWPEDWDDVVATLT